MRTTGKLMIATVAFAAATGFDVPASHAFGDAPWCAVINVGTGEMYWDCQYRRFEDCAPNVVAGNRGFCNHNPAFTGGPSPGAGQPKRHRKHRINPH